MNIANEARRLQRLEAALSDELQRYPSESNAGAPSLVAQTFALKTYPTTAQAYYACQPLTVLGAEIEGNQGAVSVNSASFFALNLGSTVPPVNAQIIVTFVNNRWVFRYDA